MAGVQSVEAQRRTDRHGGESEETRTSHWLRSRRGPLFLDPLVHVVDPADRRVRPYVRNGQVVADLGCGWGHSSFRLAELVGSGGRVYAVDLAERCIRSIQQRAGKRGYRHLEAHTCTAADLRFIPDGSVDFVFANGLLCSMARDRPRAVLEMKRILKPTGKAYVSLGAAPPWGYVDEAEWEGIMAGFQVEAGGRFREKWAVVSPRPSVGPPGPSASH